MAGRKFSDIYKVSNTASIANTDLFVMERSDGNTYVFQATTLRSFIDNVQEPAPVIIANSATFTVNSTHKIIFANTENSNVNIVLPVSLPSGREITIKSVTPPGGIYYVNVSSDQDYRVEGFGTASFVNSTSFANLNSATWVASNGYFYGINSW